MFPNEITQYPNWVCWKHALTPDNRQTKLPYSPRSGQLASVADPSTWTDYSTAVSAALNGNGYNGIGFVLSDRDPFSIIDLDDPQGDAITLERQIAIASAFDSYSEISPSGRGLHIIVRGKIPEGRRSGKIEVYSNLRYFTMTGQTYHDHPIAERQALLERLWYELQPKQPTETIAIQESPQQFQDEEIYAIAKDAENGEKFLALWTGDFQQYYPSQSEADFALINIIAFYSRNVAQIKRMFLLSALGRRVKAKRKDYIEKMVKRSFDNQPPMVPLDAMIENTKQQMVEAKKEIVNPFAGPLFENVQTQEADYDWTVPPGLLGDISQFIYQAAPRPVKEVALAAAIGLMAGICGRTYNISGTGLNQYVMILAKTGVGKEAASSGIDRLMQATRQTVPAAMDFIGPAEIASGQALDKYLPKQPCFVSIVGEFGLALQQMCSTQANGPQVSFRRTLLKLYNKSGANDTMRPTIYSDKEKNTQSVKSPSFTLLGESTPEVFFSNLDEQMIAQGLMPRFLCIEYVGDRPPYNVNHDSVQPNQELVTRLGELAGNCLIAAQHGRHIDLQINDEATEFFKRFDKKCDAKINTSDGEVARQLWNRGHIKALKLSALIAIGLNPYQPIVTLEGAQWAQQLVERDITNVLGKFASGRAGKDTNELNQINEVAYIIKDYLRRQCDQTMVTYGADPRMHAERVISYSFMQRRLLQKNAFKADRIGATVALKRAIEALKAEGTIREIRQMDAFQRYGKTQQCFIVIDVARFL